LRDIQIGDHGIEVIQCGQVRGGQCARIYRRDRLGYRLDVSDVFLAVTMMVVSAISEFSSDEVGLGAESTWAARNDREKYCTIAMPKAAAVGPNSC